MIPYDEDVYIYNLHSHAITFVFHHSQIQMDYLLDLNKTDLDDVVDDDAVVVIVVDDDDVLEYDKFKCRG